MLEIAKRLIDDYMVFQFKEIEKEIKNNYIDYTIIDIRNSVKYRLERFVKYSELRPDVANYSLEYLYKYIDVKINSETFNKYCEKIKKANNFNEQLVNDFDNLRMELKENKNIDMFEIIKNIIDKVYILNKEDCEKDIENLYRDEVINFKQFKMNFEENMLYCIYGMLEYISLTNCLDEKDIDNYIYFKVNSRDFKQWYINFVNSLKPTRPTRNEVI